jgi:hypothetical protein
MSPREKQGLDDGMTPGEKEAFKFARKTLVRLETLLPTAKRENAETQRMIEFVLMMYMQPPDSPLRKHAEEVCTARMGC